MTGSEQDTPPSQIDPLSEERLAEARQMAEWQIAHGYDAMQYAASYVLKLLTEVDRLRAENAAMREIVEAVASVPDESYDEECPFCRSGPGYLPIQHLPDCPVTKARALVQSS